MPVLNKFNFPSALAKNPLFPTLAFMFLSQL